MAYTWNTPLHMKGALDSAIVDLEKGSQIWHLLFEDLVFSPPMASIKHQDVSILPFFPRPSESIHLECTLDTLWGFRGRTCLGNEEGRPIVCNGAIVIFKSEGQRSFVLGNSFTIDLVNSAFVCNCFSQHA
jgi:hypothetical protein